MDEFWTYGPKCCGYTRNDRAIQKRLSRKKMPILPYRKQTASIMIDRIKDYFEQKAFGVCEWWGKKLGIRTGKIRLTFIYLSFITMGSYLSLVLLDSC